MQKSNKKERKGFTIVETSLVLAIAGLIFLMVFIALPSLQRSARDTQRREDLMSLASAIKKYQTNNRGALPSGIAENITRDGASGNSWEEFYKDYLSDNFRDPSSNEYYVLNVYDCGDDISTGAECSGSIQSPSGNNVIIVRRATCGEGVATKASNPRKAVILYELESGGIYCGDI